MIGIIVSGRAVPTAARTEPTAPSASSSFRPNHSMPFVNSSAPTRMTTKAIDEDQDVHGQPSGSARRGRRSRAMTTRIATATIAIAARRGGR